MARMLISFSLMCMTAILVAPSDAYIRANWNVAPPIEPKVAPPIEPKVAPPIEPKVAPPIEPKFDMKIEQKKFPSIEPKLITDFPSRSHKITLQDPLRVATWNVQKFGARKVEKPEAMAVIVKVITRYDIIVIDEVIEKSGKAVVTLLKMINEAMKEDGSEDDVYAMEISERIGRNSYMEQYAFFYKIAKVFVKECFKYPDTEDYFQVEPFVVHFQSRTTQTSEFLMIPIHTSPRHAVSEIDHLTDVYYYSKERTGVEDAIILGDFNAGCTYVSSKEWKEIRLFTNDTFTWLISEHIDTTTKKSTCPYDRVVVAGSNITSNIYPDSTRPFYFDHEFDIDNFTLVKTVSDHYPVELLIEGLVSDDLRNEYDVSVGVSVSFESTKDAIQEMRMACLNGLCGDNLMDVAGSKNDATVIIIFETTDPTALLSELSSDNQFPSVVTPGAARILSYKIGNGVLVDHSLYGRELSEQILKEPEQIIITCVDDSCKISVEDLTAIN